MKLQEQQLVLSPTHTSKIQLRNYVLSQERPVDLL